MTEQVLVEKWEEVLESDKVEAIGDNYRKRVTAQLLENQEKFLAESSAQSVTGNAQNWDPVLISLVRRMAPKLIAYDVCAVQPMTMPTGLVFAMRAKYAGNSTNRGALGAYENYKATGGADPVGGVNEAQYKEADAGYSGNGAAADATDPFGAAFNDTTGGMSTANAESGSDWNTMSVTIEKTSVTATSRQLRADYSLELAQDLRAVHGLDAENELSNILSSEIIAEINREVVRKIYGIAKVGAQWGTTLAGTVDVTADVGGRWSGERFKGLMFALEREANQIAIDTKRGKGNIIICSADVASALSMAGVLDYSMNNQTLDVDVTGTTFAGTMNRFKVYVDPYLSSNGYVVGYKGNNAYDAGMFYCPYVPLQMVRATNVDNFQPAIGFKTRYGMISNPFTSLNQNANVYYRKAKITNLL